MKHIRPFNENIKDFYSELKDIERARYGPEDNESEVESLIIKYKLTPKDLEEIVSKGCPLVDYVKFYLDNFPTPTIWDEVFRGLPWDFMRLEPTDPRYKKMVSDLMNEFDIKKK